MASQINDQKQFYCFEYAWWNGTKGKRQNYGIIQTRKFKNIDFN